MFSKCVISNREKNKENVRGVSEWPIEDVLCLSRISTKLSCDRWMLLFRLMNKKETEAY